MGSDVCTFVKFSEKSIGLKKGDQKRLLKKSLFFHPGIIIYFSNIDFLFLIQSKHPYIHMYIFTYVYLFNVNILSYVGSQKFVLYTTLSCFQYDSNTVVHFNSKVTLLCL